MDLVKAEHYLDNLVEVKLEDRASCTGCPYSYTKREFIMRDYRGDRVMGNFYHCDLGYKYGSRQPQRSTKCILTNTREKGFFFPNLTDQQKTELIDKLKALKEG